MPAYKDKNGSWFVKFRVTDPVTGGRKQVLKRGFPTRREALTYEAEHRLDAPNQSRVTFNELLEEYMDSIDASDTSKALRRSWIDLHFPMSDQQIDKITRPALVRWRNELKDKGLATRTMNRGLGYVKAVLTYASKIYGYTDNGVVLSSYKLTKEDKEEMNVWSPEEFSKFIEKVPDGYYKAYFTFLYWTGVRRSEGLAVCKDDITGNKVRIWRSIKHYKNGFLPLKTDSSERMITLDPATLAAIQPCIDRADPFVFGGERSLPITNVQREFTRAIQASGVKPIRIHDLRHSHATLLINSGANIVAVSKRLGHASINMTMKVYAHLLKETDEALVSLLTEAHKK